MFLKSDDRIKLSEKYENNELLPKDLLGEKYLYCGNLKKSGNVWIYCRE